jgi:hypothetical protein
VRRALEKDGWNITDDPLLVPAGKRELKIDLGAEPLLGAERGNDKIAVEVKSFLNLSHLHDFYEALGQFKFYWYALRRFEPARKLFLAVTSDVYRDFFDESFIQEVAKEENLHIIVFNPTNDSIVSWINQ